MNIVQLKNQLTKLKNFTAPFVMNLNQRNFLRLKKTDTIKPSLIDIKLIAFSKEKNTTLISNDYDITYFSKELIEKNLAHQIFNLKELIIYN